jgi:hypothetical protein
MTNTFETRDLEPTPIDEECLVNAKVEMLELSLTQSLKSKKKKLTLKVMRPRVDQSVQLMWDSPSYPLTLTP